MATAVRYSKPGTRRSTKELVFDAALETFLERRRLDMKALARETGCARATLYRHVPSRELLLGDVVWHVTRRVLARSIAAGDGIRGSERVLAVIAALVQGLAAQGALRHFVAAEPVCALRLLTSPAGPVQPRLVASLETLLADEGLNPQRAYPLVRLIEGFLYSDALTGREPDIERALEVAREVLVAE